MLLCSSLTVYFAFHAIGGRHGLGARSSLMERSGQLEREIRSLEVVRSKLKRDVQLLGGELPHPDLVEEIARSVLGFAHPGDTLLVRAKP